MIKTTYDFNDEFLLTDNEFNKMFNRETKKRKKRNV